MKKILFFPLYAGEIGWEIMVWHSLLRHAKEAMPYDEVHGICDENFKVLYEDFADSLIFEKPTTRALEPRHEFSRHAEMRVSSLAELGDVQMASTEPTVALWNQSIAGHVHKFISYKKEVEKEYDAVLHLRNMSHRPEDNDSVEINEVLVNKLLDAGKKIAFIGTSTGSARLDVEADHFFDKPLDTIIDVINKSKIVLGQSSGPMHLAALCEAEIGVWSTTQGSRLKERYNTQWNPFKNKVNYLVDPAPNNVVDLVNG